MAAIRDFTDSLRLHSTNAHAYFKLGHEQAAIADLQKAAGYFASQGESAEHERTLDLLKILRQQLPLLSEIAFI